MAADYILSPDGLYDLRTMKAALPYIDKVRTTLMADVRGKGRPLASKAVAARIEMDASEIYQNDIVEYWADELGFLEDERMKQEFLKSNPDLYNASLYRDDDD
jgi:nicotinamide riboside kinase